MRPLLLSVVLVLTACEGALFGPRPEGNQGVGGGSGSTGGGGGDPVVLPREVGVVPIRRLSRVQYTNALRQLFPGALGVTLAQQTTYPSASPKTGLVSGFTTDADNGTVSTLDEVQLEDGAEALANSVLANATTVLPQLCPTLTAGFTDAQVDACLPGFVDSFGARAFRRPLTATERTSITGLFTTLRTSGQSGPEAFSAVLQYFLQAPAFLYRAERGTGTSGVVALTPHELATRLAFLLTDAPPDATLLAAANDGTLSDPAVLRAQAERLMGNAQPPLARFMREWLRVDLLEALDDADPNLPAARRDALLAEVEALTTNAWSPTRGSLRELFSTQQMAMTSATDDLYGAAGQGGAGFTLVARPERRGILSSVGFLAAHAPAGHQTPIIRGAFLRKEVLCQPLATLPGNIDINAPLNDTRSLPTARERLSPTTTRSECTGCHSGINPLGFALERYDGVGQFRLTENGATIDTSGAIGFPTNEQWMFADHDAFLASAAASPMLEACATQRFFRFALGRPAAGTEEGYVADLAARVRETNGAVSSFVFPLLESEVFTSFRREAP